MKRRILSLLVICMMLCSMVVVPIAASAQVLPQADTIALGSRHSAAIKTDGSLWTWGYNLYGLLGNGTTTNSYTPVKVMENVASVSLGYNHNAAIKTDGSLWTWGYNLYGQLGNGTTTNSSTPVKVMDNIASVSLGFDYSAAIKTDGSLWLWGWNGYGQLGNGTTTDSYTPVKVMENVASVSLGCDHSAAIKTDGSLWTWGKNFDGQLGNGTQTSSYTPVKVMDNVASVSLGDGHSAAIKTDGSLWLWGDNWYGQLGNGTTTDSYTPVKVMDNVASVTLEYYHSAAIKTDGSLWLWGYNRYGQLGNGTTADSYTPVKVMDNVKLPNNDSNTITKQTLDGFQQTLSITLGNLPDTLYVNGVNDVTFSVDNEDIVELQPTSLTQLGAKQATSAVGVMGKTPGTATITATAPDGRTAQCIVTVNGQMAETISDEMILKAKICVNNSEYRYIADRFTPPNVILLQNIDDGTLTAANYYHAATEAVEALNLDFELDDFYEIALLSIISTNDSWVDSVNTVLSDSTLNFAVKEINNIIKSSPTKEALDKQLSKVFDYSTWTQIDVISKGINAGQNMDKFVSDMYALKYTSNEFRLMLELIKDNTEIQELKNACTNLLGDIEEAEQKSEARIVGESVEVGAVSVAKSFAEDIWDVFVDRVPTASMIKKSLEGGLALSELICSADELSNGMLKMCAFAVIENEMKGILQEQENAFTERQSAKNAERFIAAANIYKSLMIASCDSAIEYVQSVENAERKNQVVSAAFMEGIRAAFDNDLTWDEVVDIFWSALGGLSVDGKYETMKNSIAHIKQMTEKYDFYDICGDDVANYIRNVVSTTPSTWAEPYINKAMSYDLLPEEYQNNYQNNITRAEFCTLLTYLIESKSGESVDATADRMGRPQITVQFDDTMYPYVDYIARIGIINGTGNNKFEPLGEITREQAAKMLCETAKVLGYDTSAPQIDLSNVSDWAKEGATFVVDRGIMTGTDNGFEPQGTYTKEQAITTMVRFFENLN